MTKAGLGLTRASFSNSGFGETEVVANPVLLAGVRLADTSSLFSVTADDGVVYSAEGIQIQDGDVLTIEPGIDRAVAHIERDGDRQTYTLQRQEPADPIKDS